MYWPSGRLATAVGEYTSARLGRANCVQSAKVLDEVNATAKAAARTATNNLERCMTLLPWFEGLLDFTLAVILTSGLGPTCPPSPALSLASASHMQSLAPGAVSVREDCTAAERAGWLCAPNTIRTLGFRGWAFVAS